MGRQHVERRLDAGEIDHRFDGSPAPGALPIPSVAWALPGRWAPVATLVVILVLGSVVAWVERRPGVPPIGSLVTVLGGLVVAGSLLRARRAGQRSMAAEAELEEQRRLATVDELTGLANRRGITADLERRLERRTPGELVGVLFCDLDRFQMVNDSLGHEAGDEMLTVAARRLSRAIRDADALGRFGGDEFVIVTSGLPTVRDLDILSDRLIDALGQPTVLADGSAPMISGSVGLAYVAGSAEATATELLRDADVALSRAKRAGGGRSVVFDDSQRAEAVARLELEQELRRALGRGELAVHYQPLVQTATGAVDRYEALVRWDHPVRGTILPSEFLPVAAESPLMVDLGEFVLGQACAQAARWTAAAGRPVSVAVNVAERQLMDLGLLDTVTRVLADSGLPARQLELEVTEELILDRFDRSLVVLRQLDLLGVRLAIDDFGTSQASLGRLKELAMVSTLKIDRLFVAAIADCDVDRKIVAAIVALASSVGMAVVAEGVETAGQASVLAELGVDHLQGFLFARPGPAPSVAAALGRDHRARWSAQPIGRAGPTP